MQVKKPIKKPAENKKIKHSTILVTRMGDEKGIGVGLKIIILVLGNFIAGILLLIDRE